MRLDLDIEVLAAAQHGCIASWQLRDLGALPTEISRLRRRHWELVGKRVLRMRGSPLTPLQEACASVLEGGPGAALGFSSSASMWDLGSYYRLVPAQVVQVAGIATARAIGRVHPIVGLPESWITKLDGIAVVRPELCIYQLCATEHPKRAERGLDKAWSNGLLTAKSTRACLTELRRSGRNGTLLLETLLDARGDDYVPPASGLEGRFGDIASDLGYRLRRQVDCGGDRWDARVDFRDEVLPVVVEVLSKKYHEALCDKDADAERRGRLERAGFTVVEVWDEQIWYRRSEVESKLQEGYRKVRARFS